MRGVNKIELFVDVSPLWELNFTGISNVVYELTKRFLQLENGRLNVNYTAFFRGVETDVIAECVAARNGTALRNFFASDGGSDYSSNRFIAADNVVDIGLYLHRKPGRKIFSKDAYLFYDFSFLLADETHTRDTVQFHSDHLREDVLLTDHFFTISESTANDLSWIYGVPRSKITVALLGNNVDRTSEAYIESVLGNASLENYILILGTIEPRKNIAIILAWLCLNPNIFSEYKFVFAGRQGWGEEFSEYVQRYGLTKHLASGDILYFGYVSEAQKFSLLKYACAVIYPSLFEGFGLPVLEAMEMQKPIIASCSTSIPEVIGAYGYYFDPYSLESFGAAMDKFISETVIGDSVLRAKFSCIRSSGFSYDNTFSIIYNKLISMAMTEFE